MKILQITPYFLPHVGGIERYVYNLSKYLISQGHSVDIMTANIPISEKEEVIDGINVHRCDCNFEPLGNPIVHIAPHLKHDMDSYDIIHIHGIYTYLAFKTINTINPKLQQKIVLTHHGRVVYTNPVKNMLPKIYERLIISHILRKVNNVIVLSESDKLQISSLGMNPNSISIIPNGIDTSIFIKPDNSLIDKFKIEQQLSDKNIVLYLSVVSERKGIFDLINAFANVKLPSAHLLVVGGGPDLEKAQNLVNLLNLNDKVTFTGKLPFTQLLAAYSASCVYVLPSYFEGMPTTIMEALSMGCPVISTEIPGVKDNFADVAQLIKPGDLKALTDVLEKSISNPPSEQQCIDIARKIRSNFDAKKVFEKYNDVYL